MKKRKIKRLNLYLDDDLMQELKNKAAEEYLPIAAFVKQFFKKNLQKNNSMSNPYHDEK